MNRWFPRQEVGNRGSDRSATGNDDIDRCRHKASESIDHNALAVRSGDGLAWRMIASVRLDTSLELLLRRRRGPDVPCVLATVVTTAGSTYRKPGARMLIGQMAATSAC